MALHLDKKLCKEIDNILIDFIWKNKVHYIMKTVIMHSYENRGLNVFDFATLNNTCKIIGLIKLLNILILSGVLFPPVFFCNSVA